MLKTISVFRHDARHLCSSFFKMEEAAKAIFNSSVEAVTPHELITKRKIIALKKESGKEFLQIVNKNSVYKLDITNKNIHIGECHFKVDYYQTMFVSQLIKKYF